MFPSLALVLAFTVVFALTGLYSLARFSAQAAGAETGEGRIAELSDLLMSIAMIGMAWGWFGGPDTADGVLQIVVFGLLGVWFLLGVLRPGTQGRPESAFHALGPVVMVWMVAAMPRLMGMGPATGSHDHAGHGGTAGAAAQDVGTTGAAPLWMQVVTVALVVLLCTAAAARAVMASRRAPELVAAGPTGGAASAAGPGSSAGGDPRLAATCHVVMSLGMAGMLLAML